MSNKWGAVHPPGDHYCMGRDPVEHAVRNRLIGQKELVKKPIDIGFSMLIGVISSLKNVLWRKVL